MSKIKRKIEGVRAKQAGTRRPIAERMGKLSEAKPKNPMLAGMLEVAANMMERIQEEIEGASANAELHLPDYLSPDDAKLWEEASDAVSEVVEVVMEAGRTLTRLAKKA